MSLVGEEVVTDFVPPEPRKGSCYQMAIDSSEADPLDIIKVVPSSQMCSQRTYQVCHLSEKLSLP
jgi:hypothetical protein